MTTWRPVKGFEGLYSVSDEGQVKSDFRWFVDVMGRKRPRNSKTLRCMPDKYGYSVVNLYRDGKMHAKKVHRIVAEAFLPETDKPTVNHLNGVRNDNRLSNLEWSTHSENTKHSYETLGRAPAYCQPLVAFRKEFGLWFPSIKSAVTHGFSRDAVFKCLRTEQPYAGFSWRRV